MSNIYNKLSKASQSADKVIKAPKKGGMPFNALMHDAVQKVAMEALHEHGLYPVCNYENNITDRYVFVKCEMTIHDTETKEQIVIHGCSALLNLETGLDNDDGYKAKPFKAPGVAAIPKTDTTKLANDWINKLNEIAKDETSPNKFEKNYQIQVKEFESELNQIKLDPIEDLRVEKEYTKLKSQIQNKQGKNNGRL